MLEQLNKPFWSSRETKGSFRKRHKRTWKRNGNGHSEAVQEDGLERAQHEEEVWADGIRSEEDKGKAVQTLRKGEKEDFLVKGCRN